MRTLIVLAAFVAACADDPAPEILLPQSLRLQGVATGLAAPVYLTAPTGDARLFVVEQAGRVRIIQSGQVASTPFLDITAKVRSGGEQGLLSIAFDPQYATNGFFYVNYTDLSGDTRVERYRVSSDPNRADAASARQLLLIDQPFSNHNGGHILFGPDGMLYIAMGDGGSGGDPNNHAQNRADLLGDLLRIDVRAGDPYTIPADNPFYAMSSARNEIWAYGLRNPWRIAFDHTAGMLYIADVGQGQVEEINVMPATQKGVNYGWRLMEGDRCYNPATSCDQTGLTLPVVTYTHSEGCSVTGGYVYRGQAIPGMRGHYFYADYCRPWIKSFKLAGGQATEHTTWELGQSGAITSFGEDGSRELYVVTTAGRVYRIVAG